MEVPEGYILLGELRKSLDSQALLDEYATGLAKKIRRNAWFKEHVIMSRDLAYHKAYTSIQDALENNGVSVSQSEASSLLICDSSLSPIAGSVLEYAISAVNELFQQHGYEQKLRAQPVRFNDLNQSHDSDFW